MFELSKVDTVDIRTRIVANLRNVDDTLARDVADDWVCWSPTHAHGKFVAYTPAAAQLFEAAGVALGDDAVGYLVLDSKKSATSFIEMCRDVRAWDRDS